MCLERASDRTTQGFPFALRPWIPAYSLTRFVPGKGFEPRGGSKIFQKAAAKAAADGQRISWWNHLRTKLGSEADVPDSLSNRFTDYMAGYTLVLEREQVKSDPEKRGRVTRDWRRAKIALKKLSGELTSSHIPSREPLRTVLTRLMCDDLRSEQCSANTASSIIASVWELMGMTDSAGGQPKFPSVARSARRSRARLAKSTTN